MLLLDGTSATAVVVDPAVPASSAKLHRALTLAWPRLAGRVSVVVSRIEDIALSAADVVVSCHACGSTTDLVLDRASGAGARVAVLPCCHERAACDDGDLRGWLDASLAIDVTRASKLRARGYRIRTQTIPAAVTPKNRLLLGWPHPPASPALQTEPGDAPSNSSCWTPS